MAIRDRARQLQLGTILEFFQLDATLFGGPILYFHNGNKQGTNNIVFQGNTYVPWPIDSDGWATDSKGTLARPTVTVGNIDGTISAYLRQYNDFVGCTVSRKRTFQEYLSDPTQEFIPEIYVVQRKATENNLVCSFELAARFDADGVALPCQQIIANACGWFYRGPDCSYAGQAGEIAVGSPGLRTDANGNLLGRVFTATLSAGSTDLTSATATFGASDVGRPVSFSPAAPLGFAQYYYIVSVTSTTVAVLNAAASGAWSGNFTLAGRTIDAGLYNPAATYGIYQSVYTLTSDGVRIYWMSLVAANTAPLTDNTKWSADVCRKQLSDCKLHFGKNNPLFTSACPGCDRIPA
jgi:lambda family phage minor tail protein L